MLADPVGTTKAWKRWKIFRGRFLPPHLYCLSAVLRPLSGSFYQDLWGSADPRFLHDGRGPPAQTCPVVSRMLRSLAKLFPL